MNTSKCGFKKLVQLNPKMINQSLLTPHADAKLGSSVVHTQTSGTSQQNRLK